MGKLANRARMTVASAPGTGAITLGSAVTGAQTFAAAGVANGDVVSYVAESGYFNGVATIWEFGQGTYSSSGPTLTRTVVQGGTSGASPVALTSDAQVFVAALAEDMVIGGSAVIAASGAAVDFTGIPPDTRRWTLAFAGLSSNGSALLNAQLGTSAGIQNSGYTCTSMQISSGGGNWYTASSGILFTYNSSAALAVSGTIIGNLLDATSGLWVISGIIYCGTAAVVVIAGTKTLGGMLDRIRVGSTAFDTLDAGSLMLTWEK